MDIAEVMSPDVLTVGPDHTLEQAARLMAARDVGAAVVLDPDGEGPGILTERDVLRAIAEGVDLASALVGNHQTSAVTTAVADQSVAWAGRTMLAGGFRHLVVCGQDGQPSGMLSVRDVVRALLMVVEPTSRG